MSDKTTEEAAELSRRAEKYYFSEPLVRQLPIMPVMLAYKAGADSLSTTIAQLREENERYQWVSVDDRLPEVKQSVLCFAENEKGSTWIQLYIYYPDTGFQWLNDFEPTHWMPLPSPPTEALTPKTPKISQ